MAWTERHPGSGHRRDERHRPRHGRRARPGRRCCGRTSRSAERAAAAARLPGALGVAADARDEVSVARAAEQAWSRLGGIDLLVNNAGLGMRTAGPRFMTEPRVWKLEGFRAVVDVEPHRLLPDGQGADAQDAVGPGPGGSSTFDEPHHDDPARLRPLRTVPGGRRGAVPDHGGDLADTPVRVNMLLLGRRHRDRTVLGDRPAGLALINPAVMGPPIVWLASPQACDVHDERIVATGSRRGWPGHAHRSA